MNKHYKIILFSALLLIIFIFLIPSLSHAQYFKPQIIIDGKPGTADIAFDGTTKPIAVYIQILYNYAIGIVGIIATVVMMLGGIIWIAAGGNSGKIGEAKAWIGAALTGLVLALGSYMLLNTVNPNLVSFKPTKVPEVKLIVSDSGCCKYTDSNSKIKFENTDKKRCDTLNNNEFFSNTFANSKGTACISTDETNTPGCCQHQVNNPLPQQMCEDVNLKIECKPWRKSDGDSYDDTSTPHFLPGAYCSKNICKTN